MCDPCKEKKAAHCSDAKPAPLKQYYAEGARLLSLTSDYCKFISFLSFLLITNIFSIYFSLIDLADRFRNLTAAHLNVKAIESHLESAHFHYVSSVLSFAKDVQTAGISNGRKSSFWVESGLCASQEDARKLFVAVDAILAEIKTTAPEGVANKAYKAHGRLLNVLSNLRGVEPHEWPDMPQMPSFESKNAPYASGEASTSKLD